MTTKRIRKKFTCRTGELPVIGEYVKTSVIRDKIKFSAFSPKYNDAGIAAFEQLLDEVDELINPKAGLNERKLVTEKLHAKMDEVWGKSDHIDEYIVMSKGAVPISVKDFGITALKQFAKAYDAEGTIDMLKFVNFNITKYGDALKEQGLTDELISFLGDATTKISQLNIQQYNLTNEHKDAVVNNISMLNNLYDRIIEICKIGKILFRGNAEKLKEYTFNNLKKQVRQSHNNHIKV
ncbi:MAG: hypothetical protein LBV41_13400 [Cytophagaceae bacterium]|jgi:hypothetical protein|nr:hypothetical protein [Cytophagaceae bacterium]